jgi:hypothetical protein
MINGRLNDSIRDKIIKKSRPSTVGKIKIGEVVNGRPTSLEHFICKSNTNDYVKMFNECYGQTNSIEIQFNSSNLNDVCFERIVYRDNAGKNIAYGDGANFQVWSSQEKKYIETEITGAELKKKLNIDGKVEFTLIFKLLRLNGFFGLWEFNSKGVATSIKNITDVFDKMVAFSFENDIDFTKIPFHLNVFKHKSNNLNNSKYPVVSLVPLFVPETNNNNNNLLTQKENLKLEN